MGKLAHLLERDSPTAQNLADQLQTSRKRDEEWKAMLAEVDDQLTEFHKHVDAVQAQAEADRAEATAKIAQMANEIALLRQSVTSLVNKSTSDIKAAVGNIRMPVIPEQVKTDLTPVLRRLDAIAMRESEEEKVKSEPAEKPDEWEFDIQRGPNGNITKVIAKEI